MVRKVLGRDILILPIWYENNYRFGKQTTRQLWIYKNDAKKFEAKIVELLATQEYKNRIWIFVLKILPAHLPYMIGTTVLKSVTS